MAEQREHRHRDQHLRLRGRHIIRQHITWLHTASRRTACSVCSVCSVCCANCVGPVVWCEQPGGKDIGPELAEGPFFGRPLEPARSGCGAVPDPGGLVSGQVRREPGHAVPVRPVLQPPVLHALDMPGFDAVLVVPFPPVPGLRPEPRRGQLPGKAAPRRAGSLRIQEVRLERRGCFR